MHKSVVRMHKSVVIDWFAGQAIERATELHCGVPTRAAATWSDFVMRWALLRTGVEVVANGPGPLLAQPERAGQHPVSGCRMGICHSCRCRRGVAAMDVVAEPTAGKVHGTRDASLTLQFRRRATQA